MRCFQLDENFDDADFAAKCREEEQCIVIRYPRHRKRQKDSIMLPSLLVPDYPLLTLDHRIIEQNHQWIPDNNGGVIVVRLNRPVRTMTTALAARIVAAFKKKLTMWASIDWSRVYLDLSETEAYVCPLTENPDLTKGIAVRYDDPHFEPKLVDAITKASPRAITHH